MSRDTGFWSHFRLATNWKVFAWTICGNESEHPWRWKYFCVQSFHFTVSVLPPKSVCSIDIWEKIMHGFFSKAPCWVWRWHWHWRFQGEWPWWWDARGFTCLKRHLLIGESARLCLITRQGIPGARLPPSYPADLNLHVIRRNTFVDFEKYNCRFGEIHLSIWRNTFGKNILHRARCKAPTVICKMSTFK